MMIIALMVISLLNALRNEGRQAGIGWIKKRKSFNVKNDIVAIY
jgi:hypothetical protein